MTEFTMTIPVKAVPGSNTKRGFVNPKTKRVIIVDKAKGKEGMTAQVKLFAAARAEELGWEPFDGPVAASYRFFYARPKCHYGTGRNAGIVKESAPIRHLQKPDIANLFKCVEDALTGIIWRDDCQVAEADLVKFWGEQDLIEITVTKLEV